MRGTPPASASTLRVTCWRQAIRSRELDEPGGWVLHEHPHRVWQVVDPVVEHPHRGAIGRLVGAGCTERRDHHLLERLLHLGELEHARAGVLTDDDRLLVAVPTHEPAGRLEVLDDQADLVVEVEVEQVEVLAAVAREGVEERPLAGCRVPTTARRSHSRRGPRRRREPRGVRRRAGRAAGRRSRRPSRPTAAPRCWARCYRRA